MRVGLIQCRAMTARHSLAAIVVARSVETSEIIRLRVTEADKARAAAGVPGGHVPVRSDPRSAAGSEAADRARMSRRARIITGIIWRNTMALLRITCISRITCILRIFSSALQPLPLPAHGARDVRANQRPEGFTVDSQHLPRPLPGVHIDAPRARRTEHMACLCLPRR